MAIGCRERNVSGQNGIPRYIHQNIVSGRCTQSFNKHIVHGRHQFSVRIFLFTTSKCEKTVVVKVVVVDIDSPSQAKFGKCVVSGAGGGTLRNKQASLRSYGLKKKYVL